ncbi:MAG: DNA translocase FtsK [Actinomycetota bacterium]|jgi:DNA segregation ATPase FtsK/SpoIIIE, S-DNA-T family|uniref:DNA translocase FtsK n=1 Tax=uncultured Ilumatobacter sp. TaxID=879968 RepID=UPI00374ECCE5|nr:DNA translocase FtsK [Actinomycetota bacterium]
MSTWGPSKKKPPAKKRAVNQRSSAKRSTSVSSLSRTARASSKADDTEVMPSSRSNVRDQTPPQMTRGDRAASELRGALEGREHEFLGLGLIGGGVLCALAVYVDDLAGPLGRGSETLIGWFMGLGRFAVPLILIATGVSLVKRGRSSSPVRLAVGWTAITLSLLGLLHLLRGPDKISASADDLGLAGGWFGALAAEPLRAAVDGPGAVVILTAILTSGGLLVTQTSLRTAAAATGGFLSTILRPLGRAARSGISSISTLSSDHDESGELRSYDSSGMGTSGDLSGPGSVAGEPMTLQAGAELYDFEDDGDEWSEVDEAAGGVSAKRKRAAKKPKVNTGSKPGDLSVDGVRVGNWILPPNKFLETTGEQKMDIQAIEKRGEMLQESLSSHNVETELIGMTVGPTVTRYELELGPGVKVAKVTNLQKDIAYAMAATDVRILAPIPGRSAIGVEVPNHQRQLVVLGDLMRSLEAKKADAPLDVAIGKDITGKAVFLDLESTPHLLIAGATGAGKSSGINCIITSLLMRTTPDVVRLILIDPKQVEMGQYQRLPHLLTQPVTNPKKAANALGWAVKEMERRYDVLSEVGYRDIGGYNKSFKKGEIEQPMGWDPDSAPVYEHMPYIVIVVDELNDLMMVAARDVEESITRIAQKARAVGIHLIVATQRPSVNVITGVIKANIPARMAFAVSSLTDSRVILDQPGADKLVGKGDMLLLPGNSSVANRIQGAFITEEEVRKVVAHWRAQAPETIHSTAVEDGDDAPKSDAHGFAGSDHPALVPPPLGAPGAAPMGSMGSMDLTSDANAFSAGEEDEDTVMMRQAMELIVRSQLGSTSMLQRKLKVGFARAGRIMDLLETRGVVGPSEGSKARSVLMTVEEFELLQQNGQL